jgi:hypothetical protein
MKMKVWALCWFINIFHISSFNAFWGTEIYIMFHKIYIVLGLLYPAALFFSLFCHGKNCVLMQCEVLSLSLLQFMCKNDIYHEIFSCVIEYETASQFSSIAVHSYICVAPFQPVMNTKPRYQKPRPTRRTITIKNFNSCITLNPTCFGQVPDHLQGYTTLKFYVHT